LPKEKGKPETTKDRLTRTPPNSSIIGDRNNKRNEHCATADTMLEV